MSFYKKIESVRNLSPDKTTVHLEKGVKTRPSQNREEIKLFERSEFLILGFADRVLAFFQRALDLFSIPFFYQEKTRNIHFK